MSRLEIVFRPPIGLVTELLDDACLPSSDIDRELLKHFVAGYSNGELVGIAGLEPHGREALLRSLVVKKSSRGAGIGRALVSEIENHAASLDVESLFLLTTTAADYFRRLDYSECPRHAAPASIRASAEFSILCPDDAVFMCKRLPGSAGQ